MDRQDLILIQAAKRGLPEAFARLVHNYQDFVYRTAYGVLQNRTDAEDVTQETFIKVHRSLQTLRDEHSFATWIARITVRTALNWIEHQKKHRRSGWETDELTVADSTHSSIQRLDLEQALKHLSAEQRSVLVLREVHGFNYEELAIILNIPVGTVRSRLHNARMQLRHLLSHERGH